MFMLNNSDVDSFVSEESSTLSDNGTFNEMDKEDFLFMQGHDPSSSILDSAIASIDAEEN